MGGMRRLCTIRTEKNNDGLVVVVVRQLLVFGYSDIASFHSREAPIGIDLAFRTSLTT